MDNLRLLESRVPSTLRGVLERAQANISTVRSLEINGPAEIRASLQKLNAAVSGVSEICRFLDFLLDKEIPVEEPSNA